MKFTIQRQAFINQLNHVSRAIPAKATIPVLTGIKIDVNFDGIRLIGSDSEISIESFIDKNDEQYHLNIEEEGSLVVTSRLFNDIIRKLPTNDVTLETDDQFVLTISSGQAIFTLNGINGATYPQLPVIEEDHKVKLPTLLFKEMINQTIFSASNQESRPILTGLHFTAQDQFVIGVATDSHRLSRREIPVAYSKNELNFENMTIPKKTVIELTRIVEDNQDLFMIVADKQVIFNIDNLVIYSRLLEGNYPDTQRLIPQKNDIEIIVDSNVLLGAIDRASLLSHQGKNNVVQLSLENNKVELSVNSNERGQASEEIDVKSVQGSEIKISFNPDYMKDALKAFSGADIKLGFQSNVRPILITALESSHQAHNDSLQLLTPIRTHN